MAARSSVGSTTACITITLDRGTSRRLSFVYLFADQLDISSAILDLPAGSQRKGGCESGGK